MIRKNIKISKAPKILAIIILLIIAGVSVFGIVSKTKTKTPTTAIPSTTNNDNKNGSSPATSSQESSLNAATKQKALENNDKPASPSPSSTSASTDSIELSATKGSDGGVTVLTRLHGFSSGTCSLEVTNNSESNTQTAIIIYQKEYSTCAGFTIPVNALSPGDWRIDLKVASSGTTFTKSIIFKAS